MTKELNKTSCSKVLVAGGLRGCFCENTLQGAHMLDRASSSIDLLMAKAEPVSDAGGISVICLRKGKNCHTAALREERE